MWFGPLSAEAETEAEIQNVSVQLSSGPGGIFICAFLFLGVVSAFWFVFLYPDEELPYYLPPHQPIGSRSTRLSYLSVFVCLFICFTFSFFFLDMF